MMATGIGYVTCVCFTPLPCPHGYKNWDALHIPAASIRHRRKCVAIVHKCANKKSNCHETVAFFDGGATQSNCTVQSSPSVQNLDAPAPSRAPQASRIWTPLDRPESQSNPTAATPSSYGKAENEPLKHFFFAILFDLKVHKSVLHIEYSSIAQLVEHRTVNPQKPAISWLFYLKIFINQRLSAIFYI